MLHRMLALILVAVICGCGQQGVAKLKAENESLKIQVTSLEQEIAKLKETDQNYFSRGVDAYNNAVTSYSKEDFQSAVDIFTQLVQKFPQSVYVTKAQTYMSDAKNMIAELDKISSLNESFESALSQHNFDKASSDLRKLKPLIADEDYKELSTKLYEEKSKPIEITINKIVSSWGDNPYKVLTKRVRVRVRVKDVRRAEKAFSVEDPGGGSYSIVLYRGSNMEDYFSNNDPNYNDIFTITGKIVNGGTSWGSSYVIIKAEEIMKAE